MSETEPLWTVSIPGVEESIPLLRRQARARLRAVLPDSGDLLLCLTELATNALKHTDSGNGGQIVVRLAMSEKEILVSVTDDGGATTYPEIPNRTSPDPRTGPGSATNMCPEIPHEAGGTCGRGLRLVDALAARWGVRPGRPGTTVWFALPR
ncbi:ATP-binding protein [Actinomadura scrupuli]|uniref:ATP-binding protein n=1 Tax=Actinomadura scrupuli TaxID=559629 RepID=UPI003D9851BE